MGSNLLPRRFLYSICVAMLLALYANQLLAADCIAHDRKLPITGFCTSQVKHLLPAPSKRFIEGLKLFGCKPVINDANFMGHIILYQAAQCKGRPAQLEGGGGAHSASIDLWGGGFHADTLEDSVKVATVLAAPANHPTGNLLRWVRDSMAEHYTKAQIERCTPRKEPDEGAEAWVVDEYSLSNLPTLLDGPRVACGDYGYTQESRAFWRITQGLAMFFNLGQDAASDIDPLSITFFSQTADGHLLKLKDVMAADAETVAQHVATSPNSTGAAGVQEAFYAETRGWNVYTVAQGARALSCTATKTVNGLELRFEANGRFWKVAVPVKSPSNRNGQLVVDHKTWEMQWSGNDQWTTGRFGQAQRKAIGQGNRMILDIGRASIDFPLSGTEAMFLKLQECVARHQIQ